SSTWYYRAARSLNLGDQKGAEAALRRSLELSADLVRESPRNPLAREALAAGWETLGMLLDWQGRRAEADAAFRQAVPVFEELAREFPGLATFQVPLAISRIERAASQVKQGKLAECEPVLRRGMDDLERAIADCPAL